MASEEAKTKWLCMPNRCIVDEDYVRESRPSSFISSSSKFKLKKRALRVIAEHLLVEEVAGLKETFEMMDTGNKGKINMEELRNGLQKLGQLINDDDLKIIMESVDLDRDGTFNYAEFVAINVHLRRMVNDEHLHKAFAVFDQNHNGYIEFEELRHALSDEENNNGIEDVINAVMQDVDTDKRLCDQMSSSI